MLYREILDKCVDLDKSCLSDSERGHGYILQIKRYI